VEGRGHSTLTIEMGGWRGHSTLTIGMGGGEGAFHSHNRDGQHLR